MYTEAFRVWVILTITIGLVVQVICLANAVWWFGKTLWKEAMKETTHDPR